MHSDFVAPRRRLATMRQLVSAYRSWQFDFLHSVITRALKADAPDPGRDYAEGFWYLPSWPKTAESALHNLPITDFSQYTFVDFGSGKGRMLMLAATMPFRRVVGIELKADLHNQAQRNLAHYRNLPKRCKDVQSLHMNAVNYEFPEEDNLVLYFFNPFGPAILEMVLNKLEISLKNHARDVIAIFVHPEHAYVFERSPFFAAYEKTESCYKYRAKK